MKRIYEFEPRVRLVVDTEELGRWASREYLDDLILGKYGAEEWSYCDDPNEIQIFGTREKLAVLKYDLERLP